MSPASKGSNISGTEWGFVFGVAGGVDLLQGYLDAFAIGLIANRFIDIFFVLSLAFYLYLRGVKFDWKLILLLGGSFLGEEIPLVDLAPFWTYDIWQIRKWDNERKGQSNLPI